MDNEEEYIKRELEKLYAEYEFECETNGLEPMDFYDWVDEQDDEIEEIRDRYNLNESEDTEEVKDIEQDYMNFLKEEIDKYCNDNGEYAVYYDYNDEVNMADVIDALDQVSNGTYDSIEDALTDKYYEYYIDYDGEFFDAIMRDLRARPELEAYQEQRETEMSKTLYDDVEECGYNGLALNIDELLSTGDYNINIIFGTPEEQNSDMGAIITSYGTYHNPDMEFVEVKDLDNALTKLIHQQGHSVKGIYEGVFGVAKSESKFINSVVEELENNSADYMSGLTACVSVDYKTLEALYTNKVSGAVKLDVGTTLGLVNIWNGSGSILGIELEKPAILSTSDIIRVQLEGAKNGNYTVDEIYGLGADAWTDTLSLTSEVGETYTEDLEEVLAYARTLDVEEEE
jgi:hypothetical protein